jgi:asparagine synthase (glutamine-hydrolysing)
MLSARRVEHIDRYGNTGTENLALMCGIVGEVGVAPPDDASVARMLQAIAHRGPDGTGQIRDDHAAFGHQRLSIIDLAGGAQPLISADGTIWLVANGEIYNYRELRKELAQAGVAQRTDSDCEVILGLYQLYGDGLLQKLRGMFAFALWDSRQRRLLLARDHLGQKPLFYSQQRGQLLFASEIKAITATSAVGRNLCLEALDQYLGLRLVAPPLTMFSGINKLPPGHKLVFEPGRQPVISAYWSLHYCDKLQGNDQNLLEQLQEQLVESLKLHMVSDVEVGAYLSGGLDSSLLVASGHCRPADLYAGLAVPALFRGTGSAAGGEPVRNAPP